MKKAIIGAIAAVVLGMAGYAYAAKSAATCPGKIVCPLNGQTICASACPAK